MINLDDTGAVTTWDSDERFEGVDWDVIVIGAGPSGSTTAALLAKQGHRVLMVERESWPRYHVGESMMPFCWFTLNRLGLTDEMDRIGFQQKHSVQFVTPDGLVSQPFYFFQHDEHPSSITWQVERSEFDQMISDRAIEWGATLRDRCKVSDVIRNVEGRVTGVLVEDDRSGRAIPLNARFVVDASGRDCVVAAKSKWRLRDPELNKIAIWTYFEGATRDPGLDAGSTTVAYIPNKGWFWYIPMRNNRISVGVVAERDYLYRDTRDPAEIFARESQENSWISEHLSTGRRVEDFRVTGEYSYRSKYCAGDGTLLVGDAFSFLDPVFSSGVFLALKSGELAADAIHDVLMGEAGEGDRFSRYGSDLCASIEHMRKIVYAFYNPEFSFGRLVKLRPDLRPELTDLLVGNVSENKFDELFATIRQICNLPEELGYGAEVSPELVAV